MCRKNLRITILVFSWLASAIGQEWTFTGGPFGGFVYSLLLASDGALYAGTHDGGLYRSSAEGASWELRNVGLPRGDVLALVQKRGVIYAAVDGGGVFQSADGGLSWQPFHEGLTSSHVVALAVGDDELYAATAGAGVFRRRGAQPWESLPAGLPTPLVLSLRWDRGTLFAGTWGYGLIRWNGSRWETLGPVGETAVTVARLGGRWVVGTLSGGVFWAAPPKWDWKPIEGLRGPVWAVVQTPSGWFLAAGDGSVYRSTDGGRRWTQYSLGRRAVRALTDQGDRIVAGTDGHGVFRWTGRGFQPIGLPNGLVQCLAVYRGRLYAGTAFNLVLRRNPDAGRWERVWEGLPTGAVWALIVWNGRLIAGTEGNGLFATEDGVAWRPFGLADRSVRALAVYRSALWCGTEDGGVFRRAPTGSWEPRNAGLARAPVIALAAGGGVLWAGTAGSGLYRWDAEQERWTPGSRRPEVEHVLSLAVAHGRLYVGTPRGLFRGRPENGDWESLGLGAVWALAESPEGLWAGTRESGLYRSDPEGRYWRPAGIEEGWVRAIVLGADGQAAAAVWGEGVYWGKLGSKRDQ